MRQLTTLLTVLATAVILALAFSVAPATVAQEALDGEEIFMAQKCNLCHSIESAGIEAKVQSDKMKGPDLGGYEPEEGVELGAFLRKEAAIDGVEHKREFKGADEELQALLDWLKGLEPAAE